MTSDADPENRDRATGWHRKNIELGMERLVILSTSISCASIILDLVAYPMRCAKHSRSQGDKRIGMFDLPMAHLGEHTLDELLISLLNYIMFQGC